MSDNRGKRLPYQCVYIDDSKVKVLECSTLAKMERFINRVDRNNIITVIRGRKVPVVSHKTLMLGE